MRYAVKFTSKFKKSYQRIQRRGFRIDDLKDVVGRLQKGEELAEKYRDHALVGKYVGYRECHIKPDWLLVYKVQENVLILTLVDTGTHADLFGA